MASESQSSDETQPTNSRAVFATTHWSVVSAAGASSGPAAAQALETLCKAYWQPLYAFARRSGRAPADRLVLREQIAQTVTTAAEIEEELRSLFHALEKP